MLLQHLFMLLMLELLIAQENMQYFLAYILSTYVWKHWKVVRKGNGCQIQTPGMELTLDVGKV